MGKALIAFDSVTMRWLNESTPGEDKHFSSTIFEHGYDDPTYLTFRVEFGGWGASTTPAATFNAINGPKDYTQYTFNYDDFPCGLLDLNFIPEYMFTELKYYTFSEQNTYNAYNWLMMRNEDTRARYIKAFAEGLNELLREHPYIFLEISGLDSLEQFDPKRGMRLSGASISLKVLEGLGQRMRALLEMYKKGAWDAVYQRWILPDNYRKFKMIIYVFERRVFHSVCPPGPFDDRIDDSANKGNNILNFLLSTTEPTYNTAQVSGLARGKCMHSVNASLPVMAYECDLCEFNLESTSMGDSYNVAWNDSTPYETKITIKVGNVKTYYKNGLLKGPLEDMMIADLTLKADRINPDNIPHHFTRSLIYGDRELGLYTHPGHGGGGDANVSGSSLKDSWNNMVNSWKKLFGKGGSDPITDTQNGMSLDEYLAKVLSSMNAESAELYESRWDNWWHYVTISGEGVPAHGSFWKKLWKIITAGTLQIRVSPGYPNALSAVFGNILDFLWIDDTFEGAFYSWATRSDYMDQHERKHLTSAINDSEYPHYTYRSTATYDNTLSKEDSDKVGRDMKDMDDTEDYKQNTNLESLKDNYDETYKTFYDLPHPIIGDIDMEMSGIDDSKAPNITPQPDDEFKTINIPDNTDNMDNDIEFPDYIYPNTQMETVDFVNHALGNTIQDTIDTTASGITRDNIAFELDKEAGSIIVEKEDGLYASLIPVEGGINNPIIKDANGMCVIEKGIAESILTNGVATPTQEFTSIDEAFYTTENMITNMLQESELLLNIKTSDDLLHIGNIENMLELAAELAAENNTLKEQYVLHITALLEALKHETIEVLNALPEMEMVGYDDINDADKVFSEVPIEAVKQLQDNMTLYSVEQPTLSNMSMQSLMAMEHNAEDAFVSTNALMTAILDNKSDE